MAAKKKQEEHEEIVDLRGLEGFFQRNFKYILGLAGLIILCAIGYLLMKNMGAKKQEKAEIAMYKAQKAFSEQNWKVTLEGDGSFEGAVDVAETYKNTKAGNLARFYAGVSHLKLGEFEEAITYLSKFKATEDPNVNALAFSNLGDAYVELDDINEAMKTYKKAAEEKSEAYQSEMLLRYGKAQVELADNLDGALATFKKVVDEFPKSTQAREAENYIAALQ